MYRFLVSQGEQTRVDREGLIAWAQDRFSSELSLDDLRNKQRDEIREMLLVESRKNQEKASSKQEELSGIVEQLVAGGNVPLGNAGDATKQLDQWFEENLDSKVPVDQVEDLEGDELGVKLDSLVDHYFHPEMRRLERSVLLEIVDSAWKDHLLAMDYLRSAVGQRGMAQLDPKVEYKREGMRMFERFGIR